MAMRQSAGKSLALLARLSWLESSSTAAAAHSPATVGRFQRMYSNMTASSSSPMPVPASPACWQCGRDTGCVGLVCDGCGKVQPPSEAPIDADAYAMLVNDTGNEGKQAQKFDIDLQDLERRYKDLQKVLHPDKFSSATQAEREYSAEQAIRVNMAYAALKNPLSRAECLLRLAGAEDDEGTTIGMLPRHSEMLTTFLEWREEIEEANDEETLVGLRNRIGDKIDECLEALRDAFDVQGDVQRAKEEAQVLRYLKRMQDRIIERM